MSLVLDNLKKLKRKSAGGSVPPDIVNPPSERGRGVSSAAAGLLIILLAAASGAGMVFYLDLGEDSYSVLKRPTAEASVKVALLENSAVNGAEIQADAPLYKRPGRVDKIDTLIAENRARAKFVASLPLSAERRAETAQKLKRTREGVKKLPAEVSVNSPAVKEVRSFEAKPEIKKSEKLDRAPLTDEQRAEFKKKISYNTTLAIADKAYEKGDYSRASEYYKNALKERASPPVLLGLVKSDIWRGQISSVSSTLSGYEDALNEKVVILAAAEMGEAGFSSDGFQLLKSYLGFFDTDAGLYYSAGVLNESEKNYVKALAAYESAVQLSPADPYYIYAHSRMLDMNQQFEDAAVGYEKIAEMDADSAIKRHSASRALTLREYLKEKKEQNTGSRGDESEEGE